MKMDKDKEMVKRILWQKDYTREFKNALMDGLIFGVKVEYLNEKSIGEMEEKPIQAPYLTSIIRLLVSSIMNFVFDKIIDEVVDIYKSLPKEPQ